MLFLFGFLIVRFVCVEGGSFFSLTGYPRCTPQPRSFASTGILESMHTKDLPLKQSPLLRLISGLWSVLLFCCFLANRTPPRPHSTFLCPRHSSRCLVSPLLVLSLSGHLCTTLVILSTLLLKLRRNVSRRANIHFAVVSHLLSLWDRGDGECPEDKGARAFALVCVCFVHALCLSCPTFPFSVYFCFQVLFSCRLQWFALRGVSGREATLRNVLGPTWLVPVPLWVASIEGLHPP